MKIYNNLEQFNKLEGTAVALGNFDGVHLGHRKLISLACQCARERGLKSAVFTFSNHPRDLIQKAGKVKNILSQQDKEAIIGQLGIDYLINIPFTEEIMYMSPEDFTKHLLVDKLSIKAAFCGFNYNFGNKASGTPQILEELGKKYGFDLTVMEPFQIAGCLVSSTAIREMISSGSMEACAQMLGTYYHITGKVVSGKRLGRKLGFPTTNLMLDVNMASPQNGVYATYCTYNGVRHKSVTNVGTKPTVGNFHKNVETYIFDFDEDIYGKEIKIEFVKFIRPELKFDNIQQLTVAIADDCKKAKEIFLHI